MQKRFTPPERPKVCTGLRILQEHGLNWDAPETEIRVTSIDFSGVVRSKPFDGRLMACLEDCLVNEAHVDAKRQAGAFSLIAAMICTKRLDLPYLLKRADQMRMGTTFRTLFARMLEITSANVTRLQASVFLKVRERFLQMTRQYVRSGFWKLVTNEKGIGVVGLKVVRGFSDDELVLAAAKQLGATG